LNSFYTFDLGFEGLGPGSEFISAQSLSGLAQQDCLQSEFINMMKTTNETPGRVQIKCGQSLGLTPMARSIHTTGLRPSGEATATTQ